MKRNLSLTAILGFFAILLGAFGAHALKEKIGTEQLKAFETGVKYQMYHVIVLLFVNTFQSFSDKIKTKISLFFFLGILFFSGSIYLLTTTNISTKIIGPITPIGGLFLMLGWLLLVYHFVKINK